MSDAAATEALREVTVAEDGGKSPTSSSMDKERQIPKDPMSWRHLGMVANDVVQSLLLPSLRRPTFVGGSLPCSAAASPIHGIVAKRDEPVTPSLSTVLHSLAQ